MRTLLSLTLCASLAATALHAEETAAPESLKDRSSYAMGLDFGMMMKAREIECNADMFFRGLKDGLSGAEPALNMEEMQAALQALETQMREKMMKQQEEAGMASLAEGKKFLEENAKKEGVVTTESGLQYQVVEAGEGASPKASDTVTVHYTGQLINGTVFDSSVERGQPATFPLNGVIPGWTEGVQLMKVGGKYRFFIPSDLAYGERGAGQVIAPNSTLIFDVELLSIGDE